MSSDEKIIVSINEYHGNEDKILQIRNRNRYIQKDKRYIEWRYVAQKSKYKPKIFFCEHGSKLIGMASVVYRPYWVDDKQMNFMVLGDISIDKNYRGKNYGKKLICFLTSKISCEENNISFVIPNDSAYYLLNKAGWTNIDKIYNYAYYFNPECILREKIKNKLMRYAIAKTIRLYNTILLYSIKKGKYKLFETNHIADAYNELWERFDKKKLCIRDRSVNSLNWRYLEHPNEKFQILECRNKKEIIFYMIYKIDHKKRTCHVYDMISLENKYFLSSMKIVIKYLVKLYNLNSINIPMNGRNLYNYYLLRMGFIKRKISNVFMINAPEMMACNLKKLKWHICVGDKDI